MTTLVSSGRSRACASPCGDLSLEFLDDERLVALATLGARGIHGPGFLPFTHPWTPGTPNEVTRRILTYQWEARTKIAPEKARSSSASSGTARSSASRGRSAPTSRWRGPQSPGRGSGWRTRVKAWARRCG